MPRGVMLGVLLLEFLSVPVAQTQNVNTGRPAEEIHAQKIPSPEDIRARLGDAQLQKDVDDLSRLSRSVADDMDAMKRGLFQKDLPDKLKRLEKLSKHVREELQR